MGKAVRLYTKEIRVIKVIEVIKRDHLACRERGLGNFLPKFCQPVRS
jgi:hypothetical protein